MTRYFNARLLVGMSQPVIEFLRQTTMAVDTAQATAEAAASSGDLKTFGIGANYVVNSDPAGVFPGGNPTRDLVAIFTTDGVSVATHTIRGTLTSATGNFSAASQATTGEATTISIVDNGTSSVRVVVTHTLSGAVAAIAFSSVDISTAGGTPASGGGK